MTTCIVPMHAMCIKASLTEVAPESCQPADSSQGFIVQSPKFVCCFQLQTAHCQPHSVLTLQNPNRTILGAPQTQYVKDQLSAAQGAQTWKVLGQQVRTAALCLPCSSPCGNVPSHAR